MKKVILAVILIFAFCSIAVAAIKDCPDGFRGIKWGDPPSALGARTKLAETHFQVMYSKTGDQLSIGAAKLERIVYVFFDDRELGQVLIESTEGIANSEELLFNALVARYGDPLMEYEGSQVWRDEKVTILYTYYEKTTTSSVLISSRKILEKYEAAKKREAEKAAKDF